MPSGFYTRTNEHKRKISEALKGHIGWNKGISHSQLHKDKISKSLKGRKLSAKNKINIGKSNRGKVRTQEMKNRISETLKYKGCRPPMNKMYGEKNPSWKGGITSQNKIIRHSIEFRLWREAVFARDSWTCVWCGIKSQKGIKVILHADHIKPFAYFPEFRFAIDNGRTLCKRCHLTTKTYGRPKK